METIKHKIISTHEQKDVRINIYIKFIHIIDSTDIFQNKHIVFYDGERYEFADNKQLITFINSIPQ